jgi:hypothetical protein
MRRFRGVRRRHHQYDRKDDRGETERSHRNTPANGKQDLGRHFGSATEPRWRRRGISEAIVTKSGTAQLRVCDIR